MVDERKDNDGPDAVRTTFVGARPPGGGRRGAGAPRGIEVLLKKASVDREFRRRLLEKRSDAAELIRLRLQPAEAAMLDAVPAEHLESTIASTKVPAAQRAIFLGKAAVVMLAALGIGACSDGDSLDRGAPAGISPDQIPQETAQESDMGEAFSNQKPIDFTVGRTAGIEPDWPPARNEDEKDDEPAEPAPEGE